MTKQELYQALCVEAGTYNNPEMDANQWYEECSHNITSGMDEDFDRAAHGDLVALIDARHSVGLAPFC